LPFRRFGSVPASCAYDEDSSNKGLSGLGSAALGLAVYASQLGLLRHHARLASGWWLAFAGRAVTRRASYDWFPPIIYMAFSFPRLSWREGTTLGPPSGAKPRNLAGWPRGLPPEAPTDPDVRISRIRFVRSRVR
jgi:hypothetical protein